MLIQQYKWGQGKDTRLWSAISLALLAGIGCWRLYDKLQGTLDVTQATGLWISATVPLGLFALIAAFLYWLVNRPTVADFLIASEGELKKVSFSSRKEIVTSTFVVIIVVFLMAFMLGAADFVFDMFFTNVIGI
jgi:preprotein translocase subunit SecE